MVNPGSATVGILLILDKVKVTVAFALIWKEYDRYSNDIVCVFKQNALKKVPNCASIFSLCFPSTGMDSYLGQQLEYESHFVTNHRMINGSHRTDTYVDTDDSFKMNINYGNHQFNMSNMYTCLPILHYTMSHQCQFRNYL